MAFCTVSGLTGRVFIPDPRGRTKQKHCCSDCFSCQRCGEDRCRVCQRAQDDEPRGSLACAPRRITA